jgi:hypothetical protein
MLQAGLLIEPFSEFTIELGIITDGDRERKGEMIHPAAMESTEKDLSISPSQRTYNTCIPYSP